MTRINTVSPAALSDRHLLAEYRELPRIFRSVRQKLESGSRLEIPSTYRMGKGHVLFFYDKCGYLLRRQEQIIEECLLRGFNIKFTDPSELAHGIPDKCMQDWSPDKDAIRTNIERINERGGLI